jgi:hypothetical protein
MPHKYRHDEMAKLMGVPATPFDVMYPDKAKEMKRMVLDYIKVLRRAHFSNTQMAGDDITNGLQRDTLQIDESGFPLAPWPQSWIKVTKAEIEPIYRLYIARHYRMSLYLARAGCRGSLILYF